MKNDENMDNRISLNDGFFDLKINEQIPQFRNIYKKEYELIRAIKTLFDKVSHNFIGQTITENELYLSTAIVEINKLFQSAVVLFERGLLESGNIIIRSCLELSFKIIELTKNENFVHDMKKEVNSETRSTLNIINEKKLYNLIPKETVDELLSKLNLKEPKFKINAIQLAEKNDLLDAYIIYRLYCNESHQSMATLSEIQIFDGEGVRLNGNLRLEDFSKAIYMLISVVVIPFPTLIEKFSDYVELKEQYEALAEDIKNTFENKDA
ncbi:MAG: hypothetical protein IJD82_11025 [Clostridia bacterium]|nr:hypothetical protein [Clostridia bacterium]